MTKPELEALVQKLEEENNIIRAESFGWEAKIAFLEEDNAKLKEENKKLNERLQVAISLGL